MVVRVVALLAAVAASPPRSGEVERVEHRPPDMVEIEAGMFTMGFVDEDGERDNLLIACMRELGVAADPVCTEENLFENAMPAHEVFLPAYEIDRYEVTVGDYRACAAAGACDVAALLAGDESYVEDDALPMVSVTWQDAADYCAWVDKRLPTEAEWERAARGTDARRWPWGDHDREDGSNHGRVERDVIRGPMWGAMHYVGDDSDGHATAVAPGTMKWTDSAAGVFDLAGNVSEWVADYYVPNYENMTSIDPVVETPPQGTVALRAYRGGSWAEPRMFGRTYFRLFADPNQRSYDRGFRCARDLD